MRKLFLIMTAAVMLASIDCAVTVPPPRPEVVVTARPYPDAVWVAGHWQWRWWMHRYVWVSGFWRVHRHGRVIIIR